jgi:hypothetical protein
MLEFDTRALRDLATDIGKIGPATVAGIVGAVTTGGTALEKAWRANATATAGKHGKLYPGSISKDIHVGLGNIYAEVGPDSGKPQGGMGRGFEYGSVNQPPHLDGHKAADVVEPLFVDAITRAADAGLGSLR